MGLNESIKQVIIELFKLKEDQQSDDALKQYIESLSVKNVLKILNVLPLEQFVNFIEFYRTLQSYKDLETKAVNGIKKPLSSSDLNEAERVLHAIVTEDARNIVTNCLMGAATFNQRMRDSFPMLMSLIDEMGNIFINQMTSYYGLTKPFYYLNYSSRQNMSIKVLVGLSHPANIKVALNAKKATFAPFTFKDLDIVNSCFDNIKANTLTFSVFSLSNVTFRNATLVKVDFRYSSSGASLSKGLNQVDFSGATLSDAHFDGLKLEKVSFENVIFENVNSFKQATLKDVSFVGVTDFSKLDLEGAKLIRVKILGHCNFNNISGLLDKIAPSINKHPQADILKDALANEIIEIAAGLETSASIALLKSARDHATMFVSKMPMTIFSTAYQKKLGDKIAELESLMPKVEVKVEEVIKPEVAVKFVSVEEIEMLLNKLTVDDILKAAEDGKKQYRGSSLFNPLKDSVRGFWKKDLNSTLSPVALLSDQLAQLEKLSKNYTEKKYFLTKLCGFEVNDSARSKQFIQDLECRIKIRSGSLNLSDSKSPVHQSVCYGADGL